MNFVKFPDIESFHNVVKAVNAYPHIASGLVTYRGKIKLHGTNACVNIDGMGNVVAQSRTQLISLQNDNAGFARWVESKKDFFQSVYNHNVISVNPQMSLPISIFGEWGGQGIMKGTALNQIGKKIFAVFAIFLGHEDNADCIVDPSEILLRLGTLPEDIHILPWYGNSFTIDFQDRKMLQETADSLNKIISDIEPCDPWVKATFGVEGTAEGLVFYPNSERPELSLKRKRFSDLVFKAKGEKHKVVKTKESVQIAPEVAKSVSEFVTLFVTDARLEQGVTATGGIVEIKNVGNFLKWFGQDVQKESTDELEASGLTWNDVSKPVQTAARTWYVNKSKEIAV